MKFLTIKTINMLTKILTTIFVFGIITIIISVITTKKYSENFIYYKEKLNLELKEICTKKDIILIKVGTSKFLSSSKKNVVTECYKNSNFNINNIFDEKLDEKYSIKLFKIEKIYIASDSEFYIKHNLNTNITEIYSNDEKMVNYVGDNINDVENLKDIIIEKTKQIILELEKEYKKINDDNLIQKEKNRIFELKVKLIKQINKENKNAE